MKENVMKFYNLLIEDFIKDEASLCQFRNAYYPNNNKIYS